MAPRTTPFESLERMFDRMSDQLRDAASSWESGEQFDFWTMGGESMAMDVVDADDAYVVTVDIPGFERDEIEVRIADDVLYVEADHEETAEMGDERFLRRERAHRKTSRSITFPEPVVADDVEATMNKGVLTLTVPKAEPLEEGTAIEIEGE